MRASDQMMRVFNAVLPPQTSFLLKAKNIAAEKELARQIT